MILRQLLAAGANPNATNKYGNTPLHNAVWWTNSAAIRQLLAAGANPDVVADFGTPLHIATCDHYNKGIDILLEAGADAALKNHHGQEPVFTRPEHCHIQKKHRARRRTPPVLWRQILWTLSEEKKARLPQALRTFRQTSLDRYG